MTVKELIAQLKEYPGEKEVFMAIYSKFDIRGQYGSVDLIIEEIPGNKLYLMEEPEDDS